MNISEVSIRNPVFAWMIMAALLIFGGISFFRMGVSQYPDVDNPVVGIRLSLEGAAPEILESDVVDPIEEEMMSIEGVIGITSSARSGSASISIEFEMEKNIDLAVQEIQNRLSQMARHLPKEMDPPSVNKSNPDDQPILWLTVSSPSVPLSELMTFVRDRVKNRFSTISGVAEVFLGGYVDPNLRVWVSAEKLQALDLTVSDVLSAIENEHQELPSGRVEMPDRELNIRTMGEASSVEEFERISINARGGGPVFRPIHLSDVAMVEDGLADVRRKSRTDRVPAIGLGIRKQRGSNSVEVAKTVLKRLAEVQKELPPDISIGVRFDSTQFIKESVEELNFTLLLSALLTALVCWLFLGSWRATINVVLAIPTSVIGSFIILNALGFTLNTFTLLGLTLAVGIVIDDAVMVLENIVRYREKGLERVESARRGVLQIGFAAVAATAAIIAIFLPVAFMKGIIGKFFLQFGVTISVAVAFSLLEALTLTPMRCSQFLDVGPRSSRIGRFMENAFRSLADSYRKVLPVLISRPWKSVAIALVFIGATFSLGLLLKQEFVPASDQGMLVVRIQAPEGAALDYTDKKTAEIETILQNRAETDHLFTSVGGFGGGEVNSSMIFLSLKPYRDRPYDSQLRRRLNQQELADVYRSLFRKVQGVKAFIMDPSVGGLGGGRRSFPLDVSVRGPDWETLIAKSSELKSGLEATGMLTDIDSDYRGTADEVRVIPDRDRARARGVTIASIGQTLNALFGGVVAGKFSKAGHRYDVRVRLVSNERASMDDIQKLRVRNNRGELIPLMEVARIVNANGPRLISRQDRERAISITANIARTTAQAEALKRTRELADKILPAGYRLVEGGSSKTYGESFRSLGVALILGILISYMILASQFNSYIHPITVLIALPFSVSGAFAALLIAGQTLNIYSMIGLLLLMGIVKKNSILLVDFTNRLRERGRNVRDALLEAGPIRLRPILMTSLSTVVGALPPALALGPGAESRIPMAVSVIGGMVVSTVLTLFVVPCVYMLMPGRARSNRSLEKAEGPERLQMRV